MTLLATRPGPLADKLIKKVRQKTGRKMASLGTFLRGPESRVGLKAAPYPMSETLHAAYVQVIKEVSHLVYLLRSFDEMRPLLESVKDAEEEDLLAIHR